MSHASKLKSPQGLKPAFHAGRNGTAEAVPLKADQETSVSQKRRGEKRKAYALFGISTLSYTHSSMAVSTPTPIMTHHIPDGTCFTSP